MNRILLILLITLSTYSAEYVCNLKRKDGTFFKATGIKLGSHRNNFLIRILSEKQKDSDPFVNVENRKVVSIPSQSCEPLNTRVLNFNGTQWIEVNNRFEPLEDKVVVDNEVSVDTVTSLQETEIEGISWKDIRGRFENSKTLETTKEVEEKEETKKDVKISKVEESKVSKENIINTSLSNINISKTNILSIVFSLALLLLLIATFRYRRKRDE